MKSYIPVDDAAASSFSFSVNDKVLCFESDKQKVSAIYPAIIEDTRIVSDSRRRPCSQYFVRFPHLLPKYSQWVSHDLLLVDNPHNRQKMNKLNSKTVESPRVLRNPKLQYDESPERKGTSKHHQRNNNSIENNQCQLKLPKESIESGTECDTQALRNFSLKIPSAFIAFLEHDCYVIQTEDRHHKLPQSPCVSRILEDYLLWFVSHHAFRKKPASYFLNTGECVEVFDPLTCISLCKEVLDGIRVYFDMALSSVLLYEQEVCGYENLQQLLSPNEMLLSSRKEMSGHIKSTFQAQTEISFKRKKRKSSSSSSVNLSPSRVSQRKRVPRRPIVTPDIEIKTEPRNSSLSDEIEELHSIKEPSCNPTLSETSTSRLSKVSSEEEKAIVDGQSWRSIPTDHLDESSPVLPCLMYGAPFLLRLFVKLPDILAQSDVPVARVKIILKHVSLFLDKYLITRPELFKPDIYQQKN